jgi:ABC-type branched-subunit amino acid transport system ATPase component
MEDALLRAESIQGGYGKITIVEDVSFSVDQGEIVLLMGPNGSGKSTLIKAILGIATLTDGRVWFKQKEVTGEPTEKISRMGLGYVPQVNNVFAGLSVAENLELGLCARKDGVGTAALEHVHTIFPILESRRHQRASTLSGGERQMLAIGRALMASPDLLVLDEPTASLSPKLMSEVFAQISKIREADTAILLVEQNARRALQVADRGYVLVSGKNVFEGRSQQILNNPELARIYMGQRG